MSEHYESRKSALVIAENDPQQEAENPGKKKAHSPYSEQPCDHGLLRLGEVHRGNTEIRRRIVVEKVAEDKNTKGQHKAAQGQYEKLLFLFFHRAKPFSSINTHYSLFLCSVAVNKILKIFAVF